MTRLLGPEVIRKPQNRLHIQMIKIQNYPNHVRGLTAPLSSTLLRHCMFSRRSFTTPPKEVRALMDPGFPCYVRQKIISAGHDVRQI